MPYGSPGLTEERTTPLRERMIEDMHILALGEQTQKAHIRATKDFAGFPGRSPGSVMPEACLWLDGWFYLSTILEDYSRYIIGWKLCMTMKADCHCA